MASPFYHRMMASLRKDEALSLRRVAKIERWAGRPNTARTELRRALRAWREFRWHKQAAERAYG